MSEEVKEQITELAEGGNYTKKELVEKAHELVVANAVDNNIVPEEDKRHIVGDRTLSNFIGSIEHVVERSSEFITNARERETRDWRNLYSWAACLFCHAVALYPHLVMNWDATTLKFGNFISDKPEKIVIAKAVFDDMKSKMKSLKHARDKAGDGGSPLGIFVKKYFLFNSFGQVATPLYLIEDTSLDENVCLWYKIPGLSSSNQVGGFGFLAFCPTRCGNETFFKHFIDEVIFPFVQEIQANIQSSTEKVSNILTIVLNNFSFYFIIY